MTDTEAGLLRAILADPDEDTPRLMYADWLQENGDEARAEFIRLQCELERRGRGDCHCPVLAVPQCQTCRMAEREHELWGYLPRRDGALAAFTAALPGWAVLLPDDAGSGLTHHYPWATVSRGFVSSLTLPLAAFERHAAEVFRCQPVTEVVTDATIHWSLGNDTCYVGNIGVFPRKYWRRLELHRTQRDAREALSSVLVDMGRELVNLPPIQLPPQTL